MENTIERTVTAPAQWVFNHLAEILQSQDPHHERSIYGALNGVLGKVFPIDNKFMVKPQPAIRPEAPSKEAPYIPVEATRSGRSISRPPDRMDNDDEAEAKPRTSIDSYGTEVPARKETEGPLYIPDFILTIYSEEKKKHTCVCIIEVKKTEGQSKGAEQLDAYLERMLHKMGKNGGIGGILIEGRTWTFVDPKRPLDGSRTKLQSVFTQRGRQYMFSTKALDLMQDFVRAVV